jgi:hypothetical protein
MESILDLEYKTIKVRKDIYDRLSRHIERYGETMSDILEKILNDYEGRQKVYKAREKGHLSTGS